MMKMERQVTKSTEQMLANLKEEETVELKGQRGLKLKKQMPEEMVEELFADIMGLLADEGLYVEVEKMQMYKGAIICTTVIMTLPRCRSFEELLAKRAGTVAYEEFAGLWKDGEIVDIDKVYVYKLDVYGYKLSVTCTGHETRIGLRCMFGCAAF